MNLTAKIYSGCYGGETTNRADIITCCLECPVRTPSLAQKQIIFVVDVSGSMVETIVSLQSSLFAARNSILRLSGVDLTGMEEATRDTLFAETCQACLITFSDQAICRWESASPLKSFSTAVREIEAYASTNMGDALQMAFSKKIPNHMTWIILLTDGISNKGPCQNVESFRGLMQNLPALTKIIPLGYTNRFDPEVLSTLGVMTYIESEEIIPEVIGSITAEIVTCYGVNGKIHLPTLSEVIVDPEEMIVVPETIETGCRDIIGSETIGCVFNERKFIYGHLPWGNVQKPRYQDYIGLYGKVEYVDILSNSVVSLPFTIEDGGGEIPDMIKEAYFAASKGRILLSIHTQRQTGRLNPKLIEMIQSKLQDWTHPAAIVHKEEILRLLNQKSDHKILASAHSARTQTGYTTGRYTTSTQRVESMLTSTDAATYTTSIPTNLYR